MWDKVRKQVRVELEQINHLIEVHSSLLVKCAHAKPDVIELSALAALLHSFYTGIENIFKRVAIEIDGAMPRGESWHRQLLNSMVQPNEFRHAVISPGLHERLKFYLEFRHVFRQAYSFQLHWEKMSQLVLGCVDTLHQLESELDSFFETNTSK